VNCGYNSPTFEAESFVDVAVVMYAVVRVVIAVGCRGYSFWLRRISSISKRWLST